MPAWRRESGLRPFAGAALFFGLLLGAAVDARAQSVRGVRFTGDSALSPKRAAALAGLPAGGAFSPEAAQAAAERLRAALVERRHPLAQVAWSANETAPNAFEVVFDIRAGPRGPLAELRIEGTRRFSPARLRSLLRTLPPSAPSRRLGGGALRGEELDRDRQALLAHYFRHGHLEADIAPPHLEWAPELKGFRLTWIIRSEGPVYTLSEIRFDADPLPPPDELRRLVPLRKGDPCNPEAVRQAAERWRRRWYLDGYAFAEVEPEWPPRPEARAVDVRFRARSGRRQTVRSLSLEGNRLTRPHILLREIPLRAGDPFQPASLELAQARLEALPMLSNVAIHYQGTPGDPELDVVVKAEEQRTGRFEIGARYGNAEGLATEIRVTEQNLAPSPPFRGGGMEGLLAVIAGAKIRRLEARLANPRVGYSRFRVEGSAAIEDNEYFSDFYRLRTASADVSIGHPVRDRHFARVGLEFDSYRIGDLSEKLTGPAADPAQNFRLTSGMIGWVFDSRDREFRPKNGALLRADLRAGVRWLGGDTEVLRLGINGALFLNPFGDHVLSLRVDARTVDAFGSSEAAPIPLRLLLGGAANLRAFQYRSVGPREADGLLLGGHGAWWAQAEYLAPLASRFDLALYAEAGDVARDAFAFSGDGPVYGWGVGLLVRAVTFPVRFDLAFPLAVYDDDPENAVGRGRLSFSVGYRY